MAMCLDGVRVIELATMVAAPGAGAILADMGADVVKVERPKGDPWRRVGQAEEARGGAADAPHRTEFGSLFEQDNRAARPLAFTLCRTRNIFVSS